MPDATARAQPRCAEPTPVACFAKIVRSYAEGDFPTASRLVRELRTLGWVVKPLPRARGNSDHYRDPEPVKSKPLRRDLFLDLEG